MLRVEIETNTNLQWGGYIKVLVVVVVANLTKFYLRPSTIHVIRNTLELLFILNYNNMHK